MAEDLTKREKAVLIALHLSGTYQKTMTGLPLKKRTEILLGLVKKGYLNDNMVATSKGVTAVAPELT